MELMIDDDVRAVAEFMQQRVAAARLVPVAEGIAKVASLLWGRYTPEDVRVLRLEHPPIACEPHRQPVSIESGPE